jgi:hypothetical protein
MPTRSRRTDPRAAVALLLAALGSGGALAHDPTLDPLPDAPGWRVGTAAAAVAPYSGERWPTAAWPGVSTTGLAPRDQTGGVRLEHATIEAAARIEQRLGARLAVGWHDRERAHIEAATLIGRLGIDGGTLEARAGRDLVRMGDAIDRAGHYDRFSQTPLAKRAVIDDRWIDDGLVIGWTSDAEDGLRGIEGGLWRGRTFPAAAAGPRVPAMRIRFGWGDVDVQVAGAHLRPEGRGAAAQSAGTEGHAHGALDCRETLQQRVCFDGITDILAGSVQWAPDDGPWSVTLAGMSRRERGTLYSTNAAAAARTRVDGAWLDLAWRTRQRWTLATRLERLVPDTRLEGTGTALLARESGLAGGGPVSRATLAASYDVGAGLTVSAEVGEERFEGGQARFVALRAIWRGTRALEGGW